MKELIHSITKQDFKIQFYRASGKGGQNRNKRDTACRISHIPSGASSTCEDHRNQLQNRKDAFQRLLKNDTFLTWYGKTISSILW